MNTMKEEKNDMASMNATETDIMNLTMNGLLNYEIYRKCSSNEVEEFVKNDVKRRLEEWLQRHYEEEPISPLVTVTASYAVLDYRYEKRERVIAILNLGVYMNRVEEMRVVSFRIEQLKS